MADNVHQIRTKTSSYQKDKIRKCGIKANDWVRFYSGGKLVIHVVYYITVNSLGQVELHTDGGPIEVDQILEIRSGSR